MGYHEGSLAAHAFLLRWTVTVTDILQLLLQTFQGSTFFLIEKDFDELEGVFIELCSSVFLPFVKFSQVLWSSQVCQLGFDVPLEKHKTISRCIRGLLPLLLQLSL